MRQLTLLDLYCGAGGAAMGYHRAGFRVVGVDNKQQPRYPFEFILYDALAYAKLNGGAFDAIHASPPCQRYSEATPARCRSDHPDLIHATQIALRDIGRPFVIENVEGARSRLIQPVMLCGSMFGLRCQRHRWFETWPTSFRPGPPVPYCDHSTPPLLVTTAGANSRRIGHYKSVKHAKDAYGIDWMVGRELAEAIPPAYTEYLGRLFVTWIKLDRNLPDTGAEPVPR